MKMYRKIMTITHLKKKLKQWKSNQIKYVHHIMSVNKIAGRLNLHKTLPEQKIFTAKLLDLAVKCN